MSSLPQFPTNVFQAEVHISQLKESQDAAAKAAQKYKDLQTHLLSEAETIEALSTNVADLNAKVAKQVKEIEMWQKNPVAATDARVVQLQELLDDAIHWKNIQQAAHLHEAKRNRILKSASRQLGKSTCNSNGTYLQWLETTLTKMCSVVSPIAPFRPSDPNSIGRFRSAVSSEHPKMVKTTKIMEWTGRTPG